MKVWFLTSKSFRKKLGGGGQVGDILQISSFMEEENREESVWQRWDSRLPGNRGVIKAKEMKRAGVLRPGTNGSHGNWVLAQGQLRFHCKESLACPAPGSVGRVPPDPSSTAQRTSFSSPLCSLTSPLTTQNYHTSRHYLALIPSNLSTLQKIQNVIGLGGFKQVVKGKVHTCPRKWGKYTESRRDLCK